MTRRVAAGGVEAEPPGGRDVVTTRLPGPHNAANVAAVLALADGLGLPRDGTLAGIADSIWLV